MKKILVAIVCLMLAMSFAIAEESDVLSFGRGTYLVGKDIPAGSYILYYDENDPKWLASEYYGTDNLSYPGVGLTLYMDMESYVDWTAQGKPGRVISISRWLDQPPHVVLVDGMVMYVELHELEKGYLKPAD